MTMAEPAGQQSERRLPYLPTPAQWLALGMALWVVGLIAPAEPPLALPVPSFSVSAEAQTFGADASEIDAKLASLISATPAPGLSEADQERLEKLRARRDQIVDALAEGVEATDEPQESDAAADLERPPRMDSGDPNPDGLLSVDFASGVVR